MLRAGVLFVLLSLAACQRDETISGYSDNTTQWTLQEIDGEPFTARATLSFPEKGKIAGQAPCNRFFGMQTKPLPWFGAEQITATEMACENLEQESRFFAALSEMTLAETLGDVLILSNGAGREMVFRARP